MNRAHRYTLLCFLFAVVFVLGSMAGMDLILQKRESQLLQDSGIAKVDSPVAWHEPEDIEMEDADMPVVEQEKRQLTIEQIQEVIDYRKGAVEEVLHEPVSGQITMEEAITSGEGWLIEMGFIEEGNESASDEQGESAAREKDLGSSMARRASLGVKKDRTVSSVPMEPYYSFWTVHFSNESIYAILTINAVTGRIWDAEITLHGDGRQGFSWEKLDLFLRLAGVEEETENFVEINEINTAATLRVKNSLLYATTEFYDIQVAVNNSAGNIDWSADKEYKTEIVDDEKIVEHNVVEVENKRIIMFHLMSSS